MMELREVELPDFMHSIVGGNTQSCRDVRSLLAVKVSRLGIRTGELKARRFNTFDIINRSNVSEVTRHAFSESVYGDTFGDETLNGAELYFTPNGFTRASTYRLAKLNELCCIWVDLDIRERLDGSESFTDELLSIHQDLFRQLEKDTGLPKPDIVVSTGSGGLHLYWTFVPEVADSKNVRLWRLLRDRLNTLLARSSRAGKLYVDEQGNDSPKRVMRLPNTINIKYNRVCRAFVAEPRIKRRTLDSLIQHLKVNVKSPTAMPQNRVFDPKLISGKNFCNENFKVYANLNNHQAWCLKYANFIIPLLRKGVKVKRGYRDLISFSVVVCLRQVGCPRNVLKQVLADINSASICLPLNTLLDYMSTAMNKRYRARSREFMDNFTRGTGIELGHLSLKRKKGKRSRVEHAKLVATSKRNQSISCIADVLKSHLLGGEKNNKIQLKALAEKAGLTTVTLRNLGLNKRSLWAWCAAVQFKETRGE